MTRHFAELTAAADLPPIRLHDLRHGAATLALAAGADLKTVSEMLGHSSIVITADTYTSVLPEHARAAAESAAALIAGSRTTGIENSAPILHPYKIQNAGSDAPEEASLQVRRVRRQGLEPRTRGLRVGREPSWSMRLRPSQAADLRLCRTDHRPRPGLPGPVRGRCLAFP